MIGGILVFFLPQLFPCLECMYQPRLCDGVSSSPMAGLLWLCGCCFVGSVVRLGPLDSCRVARLVRVALPPCAVCLGAAARTKVNNTAKVISCRGVHRRVGGSGWRLFGAKRSYSKGVGGGPVGSCWMWWFGVYRSQVVTCKCLLMGFLYHVLVGCGLSCSGRKVLKPCRVVAGKRCKHPRRRRRCQRSRLGVLYRFGKTWWTWLCQIFARSCSNVQTPVQHPAGLNTVLRGGGSAGGVSATKRKRKEKAAQQEVLNKLCNFLGTLLGPTAAAPQVQASKTRKKKKKKKQTDRPQTVSGESAMERLNKVVEEIRLHPASLVTRLESFVAAVKSEESVRKASITDARQGTWADTVKSGSGPGNAPAKKVNTVVTLSRHHFPPGSVCEFSQVLRKLEQGESPLGTVAVAPSLAKALEARQLAHAHKLDSLKFACVVDGVDLLQLPEGVTTVTLPVSSLAQSVARHTRFHNMACVLLGAEAPLLPTGLVKEVKVSLPARELATVRFHVPSAFLSKEQWSLWKVKASSLVQEWATKSVVIHSSYGWAVTSQANWKEEKEEFVIGYAKVPLGELEHLLGRSGRSGVFVDRIVKECPTKQFVSWVDRSDLEHVAYLKKVLGQAAAQGVAVVWRPGGGQALGLKLKQAPTEGVVSVWRAKGAPFGWTEDDLFQVLEGAGWSQLSIVAYPTKRSDPGYSRLSLLGWYMKELQGCKLVGHWLLWNVLGLVLRSNASLRNLSLFRARNMLPLLFLVVCWRRQKLLTLKLNWMRKILLSQAMLIWVEVPLSGLGVPLVLLSTPVRKKSVRINRLFRVNWFILASRFKIVERTGLVVSTALLLVLLSWGVLCGRKLKTSVGLWVPRLECKFLSISGKMPPIISLCGLQMCLAPLLKRKMEKCLRIGTVGCWRFVVTRGGSVGWLSRVLPQGWESKSLWFWSKRMVAGVCQWRLAWPAKRRILLW